MSDRPYLKEGLFFTHDYLTWSVQRPRVAILGDPDSIRLVVDTDTLLTFRETSSLNTGMYRDLLHDGNRTEIGWMQDGCGWIVGYTSLHERSQRVAQTHAPVVFRDPGGLIAGTFQLVPYFNPLDPLGLLEPTGFFHRDIDGDGIFGAFGRDLGNVQDPDRAHRHSAPVVLPGGRRAGHFQ